MENLIESIKAALNPEATDDTREAGVVACRMILTALKATAGQPLAAPPVETPAQVVASMVRGMPMDQLMDLAIARLKAALPKDAEVPLATRTLAIPMAKVPR